MANFKHDYETVVRAIWGVGEFASPDNKDANSFGNISVVARRLGVSRPTVYKYINEWKTVADAIYDSKESAKDFVENRMMQRIVAGSDTMMIFYAKTKMKDRGYVEKQDVQVTTIDLNKASDEQLQRISDGEDPTTVMADTGKS